MLVDINPDLEMPEFKLTLMRRNETEIAELGNVYDVVYDHYFAEIDELTFNIPYNIMSNNHDKIKNPNYDLVKGDFLINLNDMYYFIIDDITEQDSDGELYKEVHCYSREYELVDKKIRGYQFDARKIYVDPLSADPMKDENDFYWGILNYMETLTTWRVDYINSDLLDIYRGFDISEDNLISIIQQLQTSFDCLFQFDTVNKKFNIYKLSELGQNKGLYISDENYIENLTKDIKHDEIKTRLYLYGKDNISVEDINLTGQPYIENFDFYKTTEYMSQDLIDALDDYEAFLLTKESEFQGYLDDLATYEGQLATKQDELATLQEELAVIEQDIDIAIANGDSISTLNSQKDAKLAEISTKEGEIDVVQGNIDTVNSDIETLQDTIAAETYLTTAQLEELDPFIKYETYSDSSYVEETKDELLEYGLEMLNQISQPSYEFNIDSVDFLSVLEAQHDWEKLVVGDIVNLRHTKINDMIVEVRLVHYQYQITDKKLELEFSNRNNINDPYTYNRDLMKKLSATSTSVDFSKYGWDEAPEAKTMIEQYIDERLDLAKQAIIQGDNQAPILDERGLWLRKRNPDGTYDPQQIRAVNNVIALTEDNWDTVSTAIMPEGIVAEKIVGTLAVLAKIRSDQIVVGDTTEETLANFASGIANNEIDTFQTNVIEPLQSEIDSKIETYYQDSQPHLEYTSIPDNIDYNKWIGDLWHDTINDKDFMYTKKTNGANYDYVWSEMSGVPDSLYDKIDGKAATYYQTTEPTGVNSGDLWFDTDDGNTLYRYNGSIWELAKDADIANALQEGQSYNYVEINTTDGLKASHLDGSYTQMSGNGLERSITMPIYTGAYTGVPSEEDFTGKTIADLENDDWTLLNCNMSSGRLVVGGTSDYGYAIKHIYITEDSSDLEFLYRPLNSDANCYYGVVVNGIFENLGRTVANQVYSYSGTLTKGWHTITWITFSYDRFEDAQMEIDNITFESNTKEWNQTSSYEEVENYNYVTHIGSGSTGEEIGANFVTPESKIELPESFKGKDFDVYLSLEDTGGYTSKNYAIYGLYLNLKEKDITNGTFVVQGRATRIHKDTDEELYSGVDFTYFAVY